MNHEIAQLRHLYANMVNGCVKDSAAAKRIAEGLLAPVIERLERVVAQHQDAQHQQEALKSAEKTLRQMGYTNKGGEYWKPPIGKAPDFYLVDSLHKPVASASRWSDSVMAEAMDSTMGDRK